MPLGMLREGQQYLLLEIFLAIEENDMLGACG